ncbi:MAG: hypothetical protein CVU47_01745 [Chloroflexi bacterium HGW-Chloroflexi-9]|nr:MAG: hypothetical protein CVU47_01745 [Chloroflexi bacterium HGW-Chloroflexi-9]
MDLTVWIAVPVVVVVMAWAGWTFNVLVRKRNRVDEGWSQVDVELARRADLIPSLVATVRGYAAHEEAVFTRVAEARAGAVASAGTDRRAVAESGLTGALRSLFAVAEAYPDLLAAETFRGLQEQLATTEDRIAYARAYYNALVTDYESARRTIPTALIASLFRFPQRAFFEADIASRGAIAVDLG